MEIPGVPIKMSLLVVRVCHYYELTITVTVQTVLILLNVLNANAMETALIITLYEKTLLELAFE